MVLTEAQLQEIAKRVRAIIRAESKGVGDLPVATSLDGLLSLPALRFNGGVPEVVEAPISKLMRSAGQRKPPMKPQQKPTRLQVMRIRQPQRPIMLPKVPMMPPVLPEQLPKRQRKPRNRPTELPPMPQMPPRKRPPQLIRRIRRPAL